SLLVLYRPALDRSDDLLVVLGFDGHGDGGADEDAGEAGGRRFGGGLSLLLLRRRDSDLGVLGDVEGLVFFADHDGDGRFGGIDAANLTLDLLRPGGAGEQEEGDGKHG